MSLGARLQAALGDRYTVLGEIGHGGMATVFRARDLRHNRDVAIKVLNAELVASFGAERFSREIRIAGNLQHPNILALHDSGSQDDLTYYVMPFVEGESLRARLHREKQLPVAEAVRITRQVAAGLEYAHSRGVIHRDVKPENILLSGDQVFIADFGVARARSTSSEGTLITSTGVTVGTPQYMSPEQATAEGDLDARSDVYALGCVFYEMLAGEPPYTGPSMAAVVARHIHAPIPDIGIVRPAITPSLQHVLEVALAKTPVDRFASVAAFAEALTAEYAIPSRVTRAGAAAAAAKRTFAMRWVAIGGVAAASVAAAVWFGLGWFSTRTEADPNLMLVAPFNVIDREGDLDVWREGVVDIVSRNLHGAGALRTVSPTLVVRQIRGTSDQASVEAAARALRAGFGVYGTLTRRGADSVRIQASAIRIGDTAPGHNIEIVGRADQMDQLCDSLTVQLLDVVRAQGIDGAGRPAMVHSSSIAALRDFLRGEQLVRRALYDSATYYFQRASELDSTFALAFQRRYHVRLHQGDGESPEDFALALRAGELNRGLSPRDSFTVVIDSIQAAIALRDYASDSLGQSMRQRLFRTLDAATSRFAGDAEIWFRVGFARNLLQQGDFTPDAILEPFDLSIDLDSTFLPPYRYAIELAMVTKGSAEGRRHIEAYLRQNPPGVNGDGMRLALRLMNAERQSEREIDGWIAAAPAPVAFAAFQALFWWPDSGETAIRVARRIANDAAGRAELAPTNEQWGRILLSVAQAWRGRMRQAVATWGAVDSLHKYFQALSAQLATLGGIPPAEVDRLNHAALAGPEGLRELRPHQLSYWATRKDTAALETILRLVRAAPTTPGAMVSPARLRYLSDGAAAYLALIRQDSAAASDLLAKLQPDDCPPCDLDRLERARLEAGRGRMAVADSILRHDAVRNTEPAGVLWRLERARAARRRGDRETAAREYGFVAEVWRNADAPLQPYVREAREALQALGN